MSRFKQRRKTTPSPRSLRKGGDFQKLHISVTSPRIVMFQVMRGTGKVLKFAAFLLMIGVIGYGGFKGIKHLFLGNEKYRLQEIDLETNGHLTHNRVVDIASIDLGASIFSIDADLVRERLRTLPEVIECDVQRRLPGTLHIHITERVPAVWIQCSSIGFPGRQKGGILADNNGITFPCEGVLWQKAQDLPVIIIEDATSDTFQHGRKMKHPEAIRALHLVQAFRKSNARAEWLPEQINLTNDYSIETICNDGSHAIFGMYDHDRQLADFITIRERAMKTQREVLSINLIPSKNIPVKFVGNPASPATIPKPLRDDLHHQKEIQSILDRN